MKSQRMSSREIKKQKHTINVRISRRALVQLVILGLLVYILIPISQGFDRTFGVLISADPNYVLLAIVAILASYLFAALTYYLLSFKPVTLRSVISVQLAGCFVNRLLPAGLGGLGLYAWFLNKQGHTGQQATAIVATNNILGVLGNVLLFVLAIVFLALEPPIFEIPQLPPALYIFACMILLVSLILILQKKISFDVRGFLSGVISTFWRFRERPHVLLMGLANNMILTSLHVTALLLIGMAIGIQIDPGQALLVVSFGTLAGALVPTPGGVGGAEAGLFAVLAAYGYPIESALGVALLYRMVTYWLPLLPGIIVFRFVQRRYL